MAARHVRELQKHKKEFTDDQRLQYDILMVIAADTGRDNSPARTSHRGIAERAGCHYNTVSGKLSDLVEWGWITIQKEGKFEYYHLTMDCGRPETYSGPPTPNDGCDNDCDNDEKLSQRLSQIEKRLSQLEQILSQRLSQNDGEIVTTFSTNNMTEESEDIGEGSKESEGINNPPKSPLDDYADLVWGAVNKYFKGDVRKTAVIVQAQAAFSEVTKIKQPYLNGDSAEYRAAERDWWAPLDQMLTEAENDLDIFKTVLRQVLITADTADGFTIAAPKSTVKTYKGILAQMRRGVTPEKKKRAGTQTAADSYHEVFGS